jgi:hypothetical protein
MERCVLNAAEVQPNSDVLGQLPDVSFGAAWTSVMQQSGSDCDVPG